MRTATEDLIPQPAEVRKRLSQNLAEGRLLRQLYRLSVRAALEREQQRDNRAASMSRSTK